MGNIVLLDDLTINKIAAGEVIERPASVVKEMVENSIDAGATAITVEIKNGGISYIRISDNGKGVLPDDMEIAFERHATSKIRRAEDLETIRSMGFRGEALASIAAIANVEMVSKTVNADFGYRVVVEAGQILEKEETGCSQGTTITVKNLFFNTPVRYKFLKKDYTESGYIEDAIVRLALVNPHISFKLINTGKTIIQTTGDGNRKNCIYSIFGKDIANGIIDVHYIYEDIVVDGVIGKPEIARNNRSQQMFFINKRYVKDKTLSSAIEQGYKGLLTVGKHAFCVLNLEMNPSQVDVNVHPAKLEVRFREENKVFKSVYHTVKENLLNTDLVREVEKKETFQLQETMPVQNTFETQAQTENVIEASKPQVEENYIPEYKNESRFSLFKRKNKENEPELNLVEQLYYQKSAKQNEITPTIIENKIKEENKVEDVKEQEAEKVEFVETSVSEAREIIVPVTIPAFNEQPKKESIEVDQKFDFNEMYKKTFGNDVVSNINEEKELYNPVIAPIEQVETQIESTQASVEIEPIKLENIENISVFENEEAYTQAPIYKFLGIAFSTYILLEIDKELYILDQHAAHERIMYEKVKQNYYSNEIKDSQMMLLPDVITLTHKEMDIVKANVEMFEKAGFSLEEFGDNTIKLVGVPDMCMELDTKELFMEILDAIDTIAINERKEKEEKFIATIACKAAVKANMALDVQEVEHLMDDLLKLPNPFTCPHGRPTAIRMSKIDIEKKFSRR